MLNNAEIRRDIFADWLDRRLACGWADGHRPRRAPARERAPARDRGQPDGLTALPRVSPPSLALGRSRRSRSDGDRRRRRARREAARTRGIRERHRELGRPIDRRLHPRPHHPAERGGTVGIAPGTIPRSPRSRTSRCSSCSSGPECRRTSRGRHRAGRGVHRRERVETKNFSFSYVLRPKTGAGPR
jgi:hypothetical protein